MIKSLLVAVDSSEYSRSALQHALALAGPYGAGLTGLYVLDIRFLEMPPYLEIADTFEHVPSTILPLDMLEKYREKSERALGDFRETVEKAGMKAETRTEEGVPSQVISELAGAYDLVVMGKRGEHAKWGKDLLGSTVESVVRQCGTPVLLAERSARPLKKMMVMFDGSVPAERALKLAADVAARVSAEMRVLTVDDDAEKGKAVQREARTYLESAGLTATYVRESGRAAKVAISMLHDDPVDLVVAGMQGHSALHDLILGSTAEHVMRAVSLPVLLVP